LTTTYDALDRVVAQRALFGCCLLPTLLLLLTLPFLSLLLLLLLLLLLFPS